MHTRIQLDPTADLTIRPGANGTHEIVITDPNSECSTVIALTSEQLAGLMNPANDLR